MLVQRSSLQTESKLQNVESTKFAAVLRGQNRQRAYVGDNLACEQTSRFLGEGTVTRSNSTKLIRMAIHKGAASHAHRTILCRLDDP
jgi:hypothetical protein